MKTVLITGASRGLGLEFTKQYAENGYRVIACCRSPEKASDLQELAEINESVIIKQLDVTNQNHIKTLANDLQGQPIDILLNNAGIYGSDAQVLGDIDPNNMIDVFKTNTIAPLIVSDALLKNVAQSNTKVIANISSRVGSIDDNEGGSRYAYRCSKTALNMVMKSFAIDVKDKGVRVIVLHPGWVETDMTGPDALVKPDESVKGLINIIDTKAGSEILPYYAFDGRHLAW